MVSDSVRKRGESNIHLHPRPVLQPRGPQRLLAEDDPQILEAGFWASTEEGTVHLTWLPSSARWRPPARHEGKAIKRGAAPGCLQLHPIASVLTAFSTGFLLVELGLSRLVPVALIWLSVPRAHPAPAFWESAESLPPSFAPCAAIRDKRTVVMGIL